MATRVADDELVASYVNQIKPLLPLASRAYGTQHAGTPARDASDQVNELILRFATDEGGNITHLGKALAPYGLGYPGVRRRLRTAKGGRKLGVHPVTHTGRLRGSRDQARVGEAARRVKEAREAGQQEYKDAVTEAYQSGVSLAAIAHEVDVSYFSLWSAMNS